MTASVDRVPEVFVHEVFWLSNVSDPYGKGVGPA